MLKLDFRSKKDECANNLKNSSTTKIGERIPCEYSMSNTSIESKHSLYGGEDCLKKFCTSLRAHATNVIKFEKKKTLPLRKQS